MSINPKLILLRSPSRKTIQTAIEMATPELAMSAIACRFKRLGHQAGEILIIHSTSDGCLIFGPDSLKTWLIIPSLYPIEL